MSATVRIDSAPVLDVLRRVHEGVAHPAPLYRAIGELLAESTKERFATGTAPDGTRWAPNAQATFEAYLARFQRVTRKDGRINARGSALVMGKKPLVGETHELATLIYYQATDGGVEVGSPLEYAAMQQFGGTKGDFPHLWGDIPARPFLGVSDADAAAIVDEAMDYLGGLFGI